MNTDLVAEEIQALLASLKLSLADDTSGVKDGVTSVGDCKPEPLHLASDRQPDPRILRRFLLMV